MSREAVVDGVHAGSPSVLVVQIQIQVLVWEGDVVHVHGPCPSARPQFEIHAPAAHCGGGCRVQAAPGARGRRSDAFGGRLLESLLDR